MKIQVVDNHGRIKSMQARYANVLVKLKRAAYLNAEYSNRAMASQPQLPILPAAQLVSDAVIQFATENNISLVGVVGTGANGRINKKDVESLIEARSKQE